MKPVDSQQEKAKGLPPVIPTANMSLLMGHHIGQLFFGQPSRKINLRPKHSQHERRTNPLAPEDIVPQNHCRTHPSAKRQIAENGVQNQDRTPAYPDKRQKRHNICSFLCRFRNIPYGSLLQILIHPIIHGSNSRMHRNAGAGQSLLLYGLCAGNQAQTALHRDRTDQPKRHDSPEQYMAPPRRLPQDKPQSHHRQNQPAR